MRLAVVVIVALCGVADASPRVTDPDARARLEAARSEIDAHVHALRYREARAAAEAALAIGAAGPAEVAALARVLGETSGALDDAAAAERWFVLWLTLEPQAELPTGSSPKLTVPFAAARARMKAPRLFASLSERSQWLVIEIGGDPGRNIASVELTTVDRDGRLTVRPAELFPLGDDTSTYGRRDAIQLVSAEIARLELSIRDRHGNELLAVAPPARALTGPVQPVTTPRSLWRTPWPYAVAGAITAGLGGVFLWRRAVAKDDLADIIADSENHTFAEAEDARSRAERHGWLSVASFAVAGGFAATAIVMATRGDDERPVAVTVVPGGAIVTASTRF